MSDTKNTPDNGQSRRDFVKAGSAVGAVAAASTLAFPSVTFGQEDTKKLKVGLIGCGGRGTGAAAQALAADDNVELHAMGDVYQEKAMLQLRALARDAKAGPKIGGEISNHIYGGLDAFEKVLDSGIDVALLATPPGFRPQHFRAATERGIHSFVEKPCASDVAGVLEFQEAGKLAKEKNVSVLCGFCYRYSDHGRELYNKRLPDGEIGDIISIHGTYFTNIVKPMPPEADRPDGMSDVEWQVKNWYNYTWLSGDGLVEQAIHSVDKMSWAMGDQLPIACYAQGGRQRPNNVSNTYDHYHITYEYENGVRAHIDWNQYGAGPFKENKDFIFGTKGTATYDFNSAEIKGEKAWRYRQPRTPRNMYQIEHDEFFASIRSGNRHADEEWVAQSTLLGIMGRMAAYTGKRITWDDLVTSGEALVPQNLAWDAELPVRPMPIPGVAETQNA